MSTSLISHGASNPFAALGGFVGGKSFYSFPAPYCASSRGFEGIFNSSYLAPKNGTLYGCRFLVRVIGFEPIWDHSRRILSPLRLPISPYSHIYAIKFNIYTMQGILRLTALKLSKICISEKSAKMGIFKPKSAQNCPKSKIPACTVNP